MPPTPASPKPSKSRLDLTSTYQRLVNDRLPHAAKTRSSAQPRWPVHLNHCFGRIILDNICERPWKQLIKSTATRNMSMEQLEQCVELGEAILSGEADLQRLNEKSLEMRGKVGVKQGGTITKSPGELLSSGPRKRKSDTTQSVLLGNSERTKTQSKSIQEYFTSNSTADSDNLIPTTSEAQKIR